MPKVTFNGLRGDFVIAYGCLKIGIPIDKPFATVDETFREQIVEGSSNGPCTHRIECETRSSPIAGAS